MSPDPGSYDDPDASMVAAKGVPADARQYVDAVNHYTAWYAQQPGFDGSSPATSAPPSRSSSGGASSGSPSSTPVPSSLSVSATRVLGLGDSLRTTRTKLVMQTDGNLALVDENGTTRWRSDTVGNGRQAIFQDDGNFVVYDAQMKTVWSSRTDGHNGAVLVLQTNGDSSVSYQGSSIWCAGTAH